MAYQAEEKSTGFGFSKGNAGFLKGGFRTGPSEQGSSSVFFFNTKARAKSKMEKAREVPIHRQDFQLMKIPLKRDTVIPGNQTIGIPV